MPPHTCGKCLKSYIYYDSLKRHMRTKHPTEENEENLIKRSTENDGFRNVMCNVCGQVFGSRKYLDTHIRRENHVQIIDHEKHDCMYCFKLFSTPRELDNHIREMHSLTEKRLEPHRSKMVFKHPFTMIVAGPTRSGKTSWVASILKNRHSQIKPTPSRIIFCYVHWQPMYLDLESLIPDIEWYDAMPTEETFASFPNSLVILDDMMDDVVGDSKMMKVFTERSHHQNISVIFMTQNIFHPGRKARTISLNTQYMVLFENPRDRQQIKTLARQMYPGETSNFMDKFKKATSKPYGKLILDLRPNILEKDRFITGDDHDNEKEVHKKPSTSSAQTMTQLYSQNLKQQRDRLQYAKPYTVRAMDIKSEMDELTKDKSLPEEVKSNRYSDLLQEYQLVMSKIKKNSKDELLQHILPLAANNDHDLTPTEVMPSSSVTPKTQSYTPSFALCQLTPPQSLLRQDDNHLIDFSEGERKRGEKESSSATPVSPNSSDDAYIPEAYPLSSHRDVRVDEGDFKDDKKILVSSDEKSSKYLKRRRYGYKSRRGATNRKDKSLVTKQSKHNKGAASSGYFLDDIQPHQISLPPDSSEESKDYDPDIYPEGTSLDIRKDEGDQDNIKSFVSMSDNETKKEHKES